MQSKLSTITNMIMFGLGLCGIAFETIFRSPADYGMLPIYASMIGLPAFLTIANKRDDDDDDDHPSPAPRTMARPRPTPRRLAAA